MTETEQNLISLTAHALFNAPLCLSPSPNWQEIYDEANRQTVFSLAFNDHLTLLPEPLRDKAKIRLRSLLQNNVRVFQEHGQLHQLMQQADIPYVILKGCASAAYYPRPLLRSMGDVDFLVPEDMLPKAGQTLEAAGFEGWNVNHICHIVYTKEKTHLEMHFEPAGVPEGRAGELVRESLTSAFSASRIMEQDGFAMCLPSPFHHGLIILLHMVHHLIAEGIGLRHLCDWAVFVNSFSDEEFKSLFEEKLSAIGLWQTARLFTLTCIRFLGCKAKAWAGEAPGEVLDGLMEDILGGGNFGQKVAGRNYTAMLVSNRGKDGVGHHSKLRQLLDNLNHIIYTAWPVTKKYKFLLPLGWIFWSLRYQLRVLTGKRQQLHFSRMTAEADKRLKIYREFHLFETEEKP